MPERSIEIRADEPAVRRFRRKIAIAFGAMIVVFFFFPAISLPAEGTTLLQRLIPFFVVSVLFGIVCFWGLRKPVNVRLVLSRGDDGTTTVESRAEPRFASWGLEVPASSELVVTSDRGGRVWVLNTRDAEGKEIPQRGVSASFYPNLGKEVDEFHSNSASEEGSA